jgi:small subunit ribosomal protein S4e
MSNHLKRLASPRSWTIHRKTEKWVVKPSPGPHPTEQAIPLVLLVREFLGLANSSAEAKRTIGNGDIMVDGRVVRNYKLPIGLMDVISIPKLNLYYRILINNRGKIDVIKINKDEARWKLVRIENKNTIPGGKIQLNLHDGRNILIQKNKYKTGDVLKIAIPEQKIQSNYSFEAGNLAMLIGGNHVGEYATISKYEKIKNPKPNIVYFDTFSTIQDYVFIVGSEKPAIKLLDVSAIEDSAVRTSSDEENKSSGAETESKSDKNEATS